MLEIEEASSGEQTESPGKTKVPFMVVLLPAVGVILIALGVYSYILQPSNRTQTGHRWIDWSLHAGIPPDGVLVGIDIDQQKIYLGRAHCEGEVRLGKFIPNHRITYIPWLVLGRNCRGFVDPQVIVGGSLSWVRASSDQVPCNAVVSGVLWSGEHIYAGRVTVKGRVTSGAVIPSRQALFATLGDEEYEYQQYEVLVSDLIRC